MYILLPTKYRAVFDVTAESSVKRVSKQEFDVVRVVSQ